MIIVYTTRLKTSKKTAIKIDELHRVVKFSTKAVLARIAIGLSLQDTSDPRDEFENQIRDNSGFELARNTLLGDHEDVYRSLIIEHINTSLKEEDFFPTLVKAHIERGIYLLYAEYRMAGNKEKLISHLVGRLQ